MISKSQKRAPVINSNSTESLTRAFNSVYDDINKIQDSVNPGKVVLKKLDDVGKPGDIRIHKDSLDNYGLQIKTDDGWATSYPGEGKVITALSGSADLADVITKVNSIISNMGFIIKERT